MTSSSADRPPVNLKKRSATFMEEGTCQDKDKYRADPPMTISNMSDSESCHEMLPVATELTSRASASSLPVTSSSAPVDDLIQSAQAVIAKTSSDVFRLSLPATAIRSTSQASVLSLMLRRMTQWPQLLNNISLAAAGRVKAVSTYDNRSSEEDSPRDKGKSRADRPTTTSNISESYHDSELLPVAAELTSPSSATSASSSSQDNTIQSPQPAVVRESIASSDAFELLLPVTATRSTSKTSVLSFTVPRMTQWRLLNNISSVAAGRVNAISAYDNPSQAIQEGNSPRDKGKSRADPPRPLLAPPSPTLTSSEMSSQIPLITLGSTSSAPAIFPVASSSSQDIKSSDMSYEMLTPPITRQSRYVYEGGANHLEGLVNVYSDRIHKNIVPWIPSILLGSDKVQITRWRFINTFFLTSAGIAKAIAAYRNSEAANTWDLFIGLVWALISYWISIFEIECPDKFPWLFQKPSTVEVFLIFLPAFVFLAFSLLLNGALYLIDLLVRHNLDRHVWLNAIIVPVYVIIFVFLALAIVKVWPFATSWLRRIKPIDITFMFHRDDWNLFKIFYYDFNVMPIWVPIMFVLFWSFFYIFWITTLLPKIGIHLENGRNLYYGIFYVMILPGVFGTFLIYLGLGFGSMAIRLIRRWREGNIRLP